LDCSYASGVLQLGCDSVRVGTKALGCLDEKFTAPTIGILKVRTLSVVRGCFVDPLDIGTNAATFSDDEVKFPTPTEGLLIEATSPVFFGCFLMVVPS
jgi:hypothetical protein